ncbi:flagellar hook-basal body complex protein [Stieleria sp. JC731]|uniref:flagellar hook-basal body protein n=1 Tax=Pirellulaceae TaxID=2691357 RepID=UPI001E4E0458|nr:flagellar hook-basal body complex protein [Stieleria sp. JC731]MCC9602943.1 flagellar hook-basal body complex protein [Stieleria sp. JC731]
MINGLYSGAAAMQMLAKHQELISSNLMHVNSSGHRRVQPAVRQRFGDGSPELTIDRGPEVDKVTTDFRPGRLVDTNRPLDIAISGNGFFSFQNGDQEILTRNGRLFRDAESGELVNEDGYPIQGENGAIVVDPNIAEQSIGIASDGTVSANGNVLGKIQAVAFDNNETLIPFGAIAFTRGVDTVESEAPAKIVQNRHELSNVQPVFELISLIVNTRQHEAVQKATSSLADSLQEYIRS